MAIVKEAPRDIMTDLSSQAFAGCMEYMDAVNSLLLHLHLLLTSVDG